jgi:hypothetical protein
MKRLTSLSCLLIIASATFYSCQDSEDQAVPSQVSPTVLKQLKDLGFNVKVHAPINFEGGYLVERDILIMPEELKVMKPGQRIPQAEQYSTTNVVKATTPRAITVYIPATFSATYVAALDEAIARYNAEGLNLTFSRVDATYPRPTIIFRRLSTNWEYAGILGSAGFPTSYGSPYGQIMMSGILESYYGLEVNGIATIMAHEMGHCIGFRHTDYFDRSISCGGSPYDEGDGGVGANHIPGTPTGASYWDLSWMLSCTDGGDRPFNADDKAALNFLY